MRKLLILAWIGFMAQWVDGSLGMGYGLTSTSLLLMAGVAPAVASASVHLAEVVTTAASGISHLRFGNVDRETVRKLTIPGSIGAFVGALLLSRLPGDMVKPYISIFLFLLGAYIFIRFLFHTLPKPVPRKQKRGFLTSLGLVAGFLDATGGGGWGPLTTPMLITRNHLEVRKVVGSVDTSEFAVSVAATLGFLLALGWEPINWYWVIALMIGGVFAAPFAAWVVRRVNPRLLGVAIGGLIIVSNARILMGEWGFMDQIQFTIYGFLLAIWLGSLVFVVWRNRKLSPSSSHEEIKLQGE
jgi:uncharacterized protein